MHSERKFRFFRRAKYGNRRTFYGGYWYQSKLEADYARDLDLRVKAKDITSWERQKNIPLKLGGIHVCDYRIDFIVYHNDGTTEYVETKGYKTDVWRLKWKIFEAMYGDKPDCKLTVVRR